jgi:UDP-N-acetylmuramate--alanine ligase
MSLYPATVVVTNIEADHLDYYKNLDEIYETFTSFALRAENIIANKDVLKLFSGAKSSTSNYLEYVEQLPELHVPGEHNKLNAAAAIATAVQLGIDVSVAKESLAEFAGIGRRFECVGKTSAGSVVIDDYAHHPTEVRATIAAAKLKYPGKNIIGVFEPHLYSRTKELLEDFSASFDELDELLLLPIYQARSSTETELVLSLQEQLLKKVQRSVFARSYHSYDDVEKHIQNLQDVVILFMGAGPITSLSRKVVKL